jgi:hypothetical protein
MENNNSCSAGSLTDLRILYLYGNSLGTIPVELDLTSLVLLVFSNQFAYRNNSCATWKPYQSAMVATSKQFILAFSPLLQHSKSPSQEHASLP